MTTYIYNMGLRFKEVAQNYPQKVALVVHDTLHLTYKALDERSDQVATQLLKKGLKAGEVVALFADKHPITYITMIAALKIGVPYVILDTTSPPERLARILDRCKPSLLVAQETKLSFTNIPVCYFEELEPTTSPVPESVIAAVTGWQPAYIMFTSGSTGFPKGVTISHASMLNLCHWARTAFAITPQDVLTNVNPLFFDNSVFDFTASLFNGACLVPVDREVAKQPKLLLEKVCECTLWFSVPSLLIYLSVMKALTAQSLPKMRAIIFGGEGFPKTELKKLYTLYGKQAVLWNVYGPTECTCICSAYAISEDDFQDMGELAPLGLLAPNFTGAVMDEDGIKEVPAGHVGELYLSGPQVALGYYNDPERTQASFTTNPLRLGVAEPCYLTGDLVRRDPDTQFLHFIGRKDNQIKHMGYRIELEEIESALAGFSEVAESAVIYYKQATYGGKIMAFLTANTTVEEEAIKSRLREVLPSYMIPEEVRILERLPKNANGKTDRRQLAEECGKNYA